MEYNEGLGSIRKKKAPKKTGIGYKVFYQKDGKLYPPMVANPGGVDTPIGVWLDADAAPIVGNSKTGRPQVKNGGKGTQGGSGTLAYRPGWHLGLIPYAIQFNRKDENGEKTLFPKDFVWAEVEYAADKNYQKEAEAEGYTENGKYRHSYAGLKHLPTDGYYIYRTNPNPDTDPWIITGAMKVNRILTDKEVDDLVRKAGREPQRREQESISSVLSGLGMSVHHNSPYLLKRADGSFIDPETGERLGFDHRFMSAGEGHQAHGWGSYFSVEDLKKYGENKRVRKDVYYVKYKGILYSDKDKDGEKYVIAYDLIQKEGTTSKAKSEAKRFKNKAVDNEVESFWDDVIYILSNSKKSDFEKAEGGHHYHVEIPDNDGIIYLEEEEPLKEEQIEMIKSQARKENKKDIVTMMSYAKSHPYKFSLFRSSFVDYPSRYNMTPEEFSKFLSRAGFVGIHYFGNLDGECYVIFDENDAKIVGHDLFGVSGIDEDFADKLNYFIENGYSLGNRYDYFSCGYANDILQACGLKSDIEIVITQSGMKKILGEKVGKKDNAHDLTPIEVLRLPQLIQKPILVINGNTSDTRLIFVEIPRRGRKMFAVIDLDIELHFGSKKNYYNLIATVYSQDEYKVIEKVRVAFAKNNIWYFDSTKIKSWLSDSGHLQLMPIIVANSMFSEKDFHNDANIQKKLFSTKENGKGIGKVSKKETTTMEQYQNRRQARASQLKKGDNITYTEDDFFRVDCKDLNRAHETIMYWMDKIGSKKSLPWLEDLLLDADGYPIYTNLYNAEMFIEVYNSYNDEWKKDFIFGDRLSSNDPVGSWVRNNHIGKGADENVYKEITKVHHKPSLLLIYEWIKKSIIRRDDEEYEKYANSYLEKIKKYIDSLKDNELIDKMVNAHKRAFSDNVTIPKQITLADCYKYCGTDNNKPAYTGIYHDPKGFAVVTNGQILYAHNNLYESKSKGNIIDKSGKVIDSKFPDWQTVVNRYANNTKILTPIDIDRDDLYRKLCMYERKFKYRRHNIPVQPFAIHYGDNEYLWSAELLKGLVLMSYAHKDVKFYLSVIKHEGFSGDDVFLVAKSSDGSVGMVGSGVGGFDGWYLDETNKYGLIQDTFTSGEPFLLDSVYKHEQGKQDGKKSNNLQLAKAKMKMAAARIKLMKM